jgi:biotin operon repressor
LYEGEFLADLDAPWIQGRRALYHELFLSLMARAIDALRTVRRDTEALLYTQRWLQADPFNEEAHRTFMELYQQLGRPMAALEHFTHLQALLHDELQMMPLPATQQLAARIRHAQHEQARSSDNAHYDAQNRVTSTARDGSAAPRNALAANEGTPNKPLPTLTPALHAALEMAVALGRHFTPTMWSAVYGAESTLRLLRDSGLLTQHNDMYCLADSELYQAIRRATPEQRQFVLLDQVGTALYRALHAPPPPTLVHLARADAPLGRSLAEHERVAVTWTINAGSADSLVLTQHGKQALRRHRLLRLLHEALTQNALPSDHDLALALGVSERTIEHDIVALSQAGHTITTRRRRAKAGNEDTFRDSDPAPIGSYRDTMHSISE